MDGKRYFLITQQENGPYQIHCLNILNPLFPTLLPLLVLLPTHFILISSHASSYPAHLFLLPPLVLCFHYLRVDAGISPMNRKDVFYSGSLNNIPMYRSNPDLYHKSVTSIHKLGVDGSPLPSKESSPGE